MIDLTEISDIEHLMMWSEEVISRLHPLSAYLRLAFPGPDNSYSDK
ncbi:MAG: hypothetical protein K2G11_04060 [Muribaculaceae bacterium]|nr:hypothetical protein [Muribaculaceae bacterium]